MDRVPRGVLCGAFGSSIESIVENLVGRAEKLGAGASNSTISQVIGSFTSHLSSDFCFHFVEFGNFFKRPCRSSVEDSQLQVEKDLTSRYWHSSHNCLDAYLPIVQ